MSVIPQEPCSVTLSRLRNLYPGSTKNTDVVSSINFLNPIVSFVGPEALHSSFDDD